MYEFKCQVGPSTRRVTQPLAPDKIENLGASDFQENPLYRVYEKYIYVRVQLVETPLLRYQLFLFFLLLFFWPTH